MHTLRVHEVLNPNGVLCDDRIRWNDGVKLFGARRELLFLACSTKTMNPAWDVVVGFNPRAHLFEEIRHVFLMAETLLAQADAKSLEGQVGVLGNSVETSQEGVDSNELTLILRASVMYLFGTLCAILPERDERKLEHAFDYLASVSQQKDELLPLMVENFLGKDFRVVYETLCDDYYYQRSEQLNRRREWLYQAEKVLTEACTRPLNVAWKSSLSSQLYVNGVPTVSRPAGTSIFLPIFSTNRFIASQNCWNVEALCSELVQAGCSEFVLFDCFHDRLRWVERVSKNRQTQRMEAVRQDPLRSHSFFDSRAGRARLLLLSADSLNYLERLLKTTSIAQFSIPVQEALDTALEMGRMRRTLGLGPDPALDVLNLYRALAGEHESLKGDSSDIPTLERIFAPHETEEQIFSFSG
ncbi:MAG: hypothetical protein RIR26_261 [Pseudomonadota bacterium]|jgi:hypothetical protein